MILLIKKENTHTYYFIMYKSILKKSTFVASIQNLFLTEQNKTILILLEHEFSDKEQLYFLISLSIIMLIRNIGENCNLNYSGNT